MGKKEEDEKAAAEEAQRKAEEAKKKAKDAADERARKEAEDKKKKEAVEKAVTEVVEQAKNVTSECDSTAPCADQINAMRTEAESLKEKIQAASAGSGAAASTTAAQ